MAGSSLVTSVTHTKAKAAAGKQKPYWVEFQLVDEQNEPVANMPWTVESTHPVSGPVEGFTYSGQSDADGFIRIDMPHGLELSLKLESTALVNEMEKRSLRPGRDAETDSLVRQSAIDAGHIWHYLVVGELSSGYPNVELHKGETLPSFHFPPNKSFKGLTVRTNELEKRHIIEICPFRAWELVLHHQDKYSMANAINLGASASLAYADDKALRPESITRFYINQCQDLSRLPQLHKGGFSYNTLVQDIPFSKRYNPPVFMDTSRDTSKTDNKSGSTSEGGNPAKPEGDTQLYYVYNTDKVIVVWRGTAGLYDVGTDLAFSPVSTEVCEVNKTMCTNLSPTGKVHDGFLSGYNRSERLFSSEFDELLTLIKARDLFVCGHSLGGALALIYSAALKAEKPLLYTYGMPRTFTKEAVQQLSEITHFRHVNDNDPVPAVPPEANLDNELYNLWGPLWKTLGMLWSVGELLAYQAVSWGDCFWHHGNPVVFLIATQSREWQECKTSLPVPAGCINLKRLLPIKAKLYLVPSLSDQEMQTAGFKQKEFRKSLTTSKLEEIFPDGQNPGRGADLTFGDHFMTSYMPYMNNKLLELIDNEGMVENRNFTEHLYNVDRFKEQMSVHKDEIPEKEYERNELFLDIEGLLKASLSPTLSESYGNDALVRFSIYGDEVIENA